MIPTRKSELNIPESEERAAHKNSMKIARKRHENHTRYKKEINAIMEASINSETRFSTKW
jgi:hypothetical protein